MDVVLDVVADWKTKCFRLSFTGPSNILTAAIVAFVLSAAMLFVLHRAGLLP